MDKVKTGGESRQVLEEFLEALKSPVSDLRGHIEQVAELAISEDAEAAEQATGAFFTSFVERLADSFEPEGVTLYNRAFAQLIQHCRAADRSGALEGELTRFGLISEDEIIARAESLRRKKPASWLASSALDVRRVIVLSRVTLGADVAITSVIIERMKRAFPRAEITLIGGRKATELFGGDARLSFKEISYRRAGTTLERLLSWIDVLGCVRQLTNGLRFREYLVLDTDSRLTQLGLLPVSRGVEPSAETRLDDDYLFFPSREYGSNTSRPLGRLACDWLNEMFGFEEQVYPHVSLGRSDIEAAGAAVRRIKRESRPVVSINFGVGENPLKRVGGDFETQMVNHLLSDGAMVILDMGAGEDEMRRANGVISGAARARREGRAIKVIELNENGLKALAGSDYVSADLVVWSGRIGMLAALIGESDLYIGYDSAGQHIAASLGVPSIDVFAGFSSPRMLERWRPYGKADVRVVPIYEQAPAGTQAILSSVLDHARDMLAAGR